jgi:hypothetical protein
MVDGWRHVRHRSWIRKATNAPAGKGSTAIIDARETAEKLWTFSNGLIVHTYAKQEWGIDLQIVPRLSHEVLTATLMATQIMISYRVVFVRTPVL